MQSITHLYFQPLRITPLDLFLMETAKIYFLKCKEVGSKLVPLPPEEPWEMTNFIR